MNKDKTIEKRAPHYAQTTWNESEGEIYRGNDPICDIVDYRGSEVDKANARLIAQAPAMYDMLRDVLVEYQAEAKSEGWDLPIIGEEVRELLAKVDGGDEG